MGIDTKMYVCKLLDCELQARCKIRDIVRFSLPQRHIQ
ncbi:hypothetical protein D3OALGA1CA_1773 [Olavius algarvensis associated proteobacterium Delta 3]|nr:hypothetical protein D3OALGA1CA_1773 [Olavius algarvensis associated proteobacterium Delta 3]CAB5136883.1 hypothetical protein D3OALGB2SA_3990 [Olavius algarvensis associated proteobacterium Delta 3]